VIDTSHADESAAMDIYDVLVDRTKDLQAANYERTLYRAWFGAALDALHEQHDELERQRRQIHALIHENRRLRGVELSPEAA
jgi:hypothetical protein